MSPILPLNDDELDELDDFLMSEGMPENSMDISTLDGFFAALVVNPKLIMPSEYLPWVWDMEQGEDQPVFPSLQYANRMLELIMRHYNDELSAISNDKFAPLFYTLAQPDGSEFFDAEGWCEGFMLGITVFGDPWQEVLENHPELIAPMVLLGTEQGWEMLEQSGNNKQATQDAYEAIAGAVALLYDHFQEQREENARVRLSRPGRHPSGLLVEAISMSVKVGRNEECPCGSGKKFKKCCGAAPTLH